MFGSRNQKSVCFISDLQNNARSIASSGIGQRETLCSDDDSFLQTVLMIGTANCVRSTKRHCQEIPLSERAYIVVGDNLREFTKMHQ